jgi:zinc/manganese transport system substrate-binding protein
MAAVSCGTAPAGTTGGPAATAGPPCPTSPIPIVVTVDQWGDIVRELAGACGAVTTIVEGSSADPHGYEPTPADQASLSDARLVVMNGAGYDTWAAKAVEARSPRPAVIDAADVVGRHEGDNPHLWYSPAFLDQISAAISAELDDLEPGDATYFADRAAAWKRTLEPYHREIDAIRQADGGRTFAATESVFDDMAEAVGLRNLTPSGFAAAAAAGSEPSPGDINEFQELLRGGQVDVLIFNTQTEGSVPSQLRSAAEGAGVPVVEVTETVAPGAPSFVDWQVDQLRRLGSALAATPASR